MPGLFSLNSKVVNNGKTYNAISILIFMVLERILDSAIKGSKWYGKAVKENYRQFIPSLVVSSACAFGGQEIAERFQIASEWAVQLSGYIGGTIGGYTTFLSLEYKNKKEKYPNGFISKEMGKTLVDLTSSDYLADMISFAPVFIAVNHQLLNDGVDPGVSGGVSALVGSTTYFFTMCGFYDGFQRLTNKVNSRIRKWYNSIKGE